MFKKIIKGMVVAGAMLGLVGTAGAADININIYGASAQYLFWNDSADDWLTSLGYTTGLAQAVDASGKHGITKGSKGADTIYVRYSSKASYDGIYACKGVDPATNSNISDSCAAAAPHNQRTMATTVDWTTGTVTGLGCQTVTIGASDVDGKTFGQTSYGQKLGHLGGGIISRSVPSIDTTGMTSYKPVVVPFGFFASTDAPIDNLTRLQALMIYSYKVYTWDNFGLADTRDIIACARHAGSGTHATLDAAVMRKDAVLNGVEDNGYFWFNDGSSDMMRCIDQKGTTDAAERAGRAAVGYADADQIVSFPSYGVCDYDTTNDVPDCKFENVKALNYNGAAAVKENIKNGVYSFWSAQWLFECDPDDTVTHPLISNGTNGLADYASIAANLPASKADFWNAQNEMNVTKANDFAMPSF